VREHSEPEPEETATPAPVGGPSASAGSSPGGTGSSPGAAGSSPGGTGSSPGAAELLEYLACGLVDRPDEVSVERFEEDDGTVVLELAVGEQEYGRVIGRGGRTAQALRTVVRAGAGDGRRLVVDIVD